MAVPAAHLDIIRIALAAAGGRYEIALAGGNALRLHEVTRRHTEDVDLFVRRLEQVRGAADVIADSLEAHGYAVTPIGVDEGLAAWWEEAGEGLAELEVTAPGGEQPVPIQIAYFEYDKRVPSEVGPVLSLDDLAGWKVHALADRGDPRDFADVAAFLALGYSIDELIRLATERDNSLLPEDFAEAGARLDMIRDRRLNQHLTDGKDAAWIRELFTDWPREPRRPEE